MTTLDSTPDHQPDVCAVDASCVDSGCGCSKPRVTGAAPTISRPGLKAGLLAAACAVACLAVPLAVGGVAAVSGAVAEEWWLLVGLAAAAIVIGVAVAGRRRAGNLC